MSRAHGLGAWMIAALAVAAAVANPRFTRTEATGAAALTQSATASTTGASPRNQSAEDDEIDTLQTIGESLAVDVSTDGLKRRATWTLRQFPFQQHTKLEILSWIYIGVTFTTILTVLVQVKRHEIVARLTSSAPGVRVTWDGGFVLKVAVFALLPLLVLFAAQFPDIGGLILRWMEPVQRALP